MAASVSPAQAKRELARRKFNNDRGDKPFRKATCQAARQMLKPALKAIIASGKSTSTPEPKGSTKAAAKATRKAAQNVSGGNKFTQAANAEHGPLSELDAAGKAAWWATYKAESAKASEKASA